MAANPSPSHSFSIGTLAKQAQVGIDTIRYYEREGLLPAPRRRASGYREYDAGAIQRVRFIRRAKDLGFTLEEIRALLALESDRDHGVQAIKARATERLAELDRRIAEMTETRNELAQLVDACPGHGEPEACPILSSIHAGASGATPACCPGPSGTVDAPGSP